MNKNTGNESFIGAYDEEFKKKDNFFLSKFKEKFSNFSVNEKNNFFLYLNLKTTENQKKRKEAYKKLLGETVEAYKNVPKSKTKDIIENLLKVPKKNIFFYMRKIDDQFGGFFFDDGKEKTRSKNKRTASSSSNNTNQNSMMDDDDVMTDGTTLEHKENIMDKIHALDPDYLPSHQKDVFLLKDREISTLIMCFYSMLERMGAFLRKYVIYIITYGSIMTAKKICDEIDIRAKAIDHLFENIASNFRKTKFALTKNQTKNKICKDAFIQEVRLTMLSLKKHFPNIILSYKGSVVEKINETKKKLGSFFEKKKKEGNDSKSFSIPENLFCDRVEFNFIQEMISHYTKAKDQQKLPPMSIAFPVFKNANSNTSMFHKKDKSCMSEIEYKTQPSKKKYISNDTLLHENFWKVFVSTTPKSNDTLKVKVSCFQNFFSEETWRLRDANIRREIEIINQREKTDMSIVKKTSCENYEQRIAKSSVPFFSSQLYLLNQVVNSQEQFNKFFWNTPLKRIFSEQKREEKPQHVVWNDFIKAIGRKPISNVPDNLIIDRSTATILGMAENKYNLFHSLTQSIEKRERSTTEDPKDFVVNQLNNQGKTVVPYLGMNLNPLIMSTTYHLKSSGVKDDNDIKTNCFLLTQCMQSLIIGEIDFLYYTSRLNNITLLNEKTGFATENYKGFERTGKSGTTMIADVKDEINKSWNPNKGIDDALMKKFEKLTIGNDTGRGVDRVRKIIENEKKINNNNY